MINERIGALKENERKQVLIYQSTELDRLVVQRILYGYGNSAAVYAILSGIIHPIFLEVYEAVQEDGNAYILEEYLRGNAVRDIYS